MAIVAATTHIAASVVNLPLELVPLLLLLLLLLPLHVRRRWSLSTSPSHRLREQGAHATSGKEGMVRVDIILQTDAKCEGGLQGGTRVGGEFFSFLFTTTVTFLRSHRTIKLLRSSFFTFSFARYLQHAAWTGEVPIDTVSTIRSGPARLSLLWARFPKALLPLHLSLYLTVCF